MDVRFDKMFIIGFKLTPIQKENVKTIKEFIREEIKKAKREVLERVLKNGHGGGNFKRLIIIMLGLLGKEK